MARIFSHVVGHVDNKLVSYFPADFDYLAMLKQLSEEAGVDVVMTGKEISMKGIWVAMERVHELMTTAVGMYGSCAVAKYGVDSIMGGHFTTNQSHFEVKSSTENENKPVQLESFITHSNTDMPYEYEKLHSNTYSDLTLKEETLNCEIVSKMESENKDCCLSSDGSNSKDQAQTQIKRSRRKNKTISSKNHIRARLTERKRDRKRKHGTNDTAEKVRKKPGKATKYPRGPNGLYQCLDCDYTAKSYSTLKGHRLNVHLSTPTACDICEKVFSNRRYMVKHRVTHETEPQHCCDVCGKIYKTKLRMLEHRETHAEGYTRPSFECDVCKKTYISAYILSCHVKKEHLGQKKSFLCSICGKSFTLQFSLKEHLNTHTGAKPNVCDICGRGFSFKSALRVHRMTHDESQKKFECSVCNKRFYQPKELRTHERSHNPDAERPFTCRHCGKSFHDASKVRRHLIMVHKIHKTINTWREDVMYSSSLQSSTAFDIMDPSLLNISME